jgi:CRISPR/Cas system-associated exonuclease Cas4 (RecB family)
VLREQVVQATRAVRAMLDAGRLPPPTDDEQRCPRCSMKPRCQPEAARRMTANAVPDPFDPEA